MKYDLGLPRRVVEMPLEVPGASEGNMKEMNENDDQRMMQRKVKKPREMVWWDRVTVEERRPKKKHTRHTAAVKGKRTAAFFKNIVTARNQG